ncbi:MAG TPA: hypothetical protein VN663_10040 [Ramlibacter sp.]|nr:hypothetical protein [Ramlibacter sp.]
MNTLARTNLLIQVLHLLPSRVRKALDAWSYRVARKHAERRRLATSARKNRTAAVMEQYKLPSDWPA